MSQYEPAPEWQVEKWFNTEQPIRLAGLRGKVVVLHAFQMLCPGCVSHGVPQAERLHRLLKGQDAAVVGLHTVFEHHAAMTPVALEAFLHEYRITHPVGVDVPDAQGDIPTSMRRYGFQGTPSLVLIDRQGRIRHQALGGIDDLAVGLMVGRLLEE
ncbi:MAG: redoxin family protein [Burkholderiaceae bacterium]